MERRWQRHCWPRQLPLFFLLILLFLATLVSADCECGYSSSIGGSNTHLRAVFTDLIESDFSADGYDINTDTDWVRQAFNLTNEKARGAYGEMFAVENVVVMKPPTISDRKDGDDGQTEWQGSSSSEGLSLMVRTELVEGMVPVAEVDTRRLDMHWGTFRASIKMTGERGTCAAFFWYFNDTQEIDMEFLSKEFNRSNSSYPVNLVLQSREAMQAGFDAHGTKNFVKAYLPFDPTSDYHEYRIDYLPNRVYFFADGIPLAEMDGPAVPTSAGHLILQHWSNGNKLWSGGPPAKDSALMVKYVKAYFNSSTIQRQQDWQNRCKNPLAHRAVCNIPDVTPTNYSAARWFFRDQENMTNNQTLSGESEGSRLERVWCMTFYALLFVTGWAFALW